MELKIIAHIRTDLPEKFGIPRQSGLAKNLKGTIVFETEYRNPDALKGIEEFNYIWLIWQFQGTGRESWSPTVRPPRLGGNTHVGVFATRSPFRPNSIGLSSVKLDSVDYVSENGPLLHVSGIDLKDNTPIYDIKPYLHYIDSHEDALDGFAENTKDYKLDVDFPKELLDKLPENKREGIIEILSQDPRPAYHNDGERQYGVAYAGYDVHFTVKEGKVQVYSVTQLKF
jgi:tRNA-Thr(GGU) m(6)t(6)A37 methyltransferase TsaA